MKLSIKNAKVAIEGDIELDMPDTLLESDKAEAQGKRFDRLVTLAGPVTEIIGNYISLERLKYVSQKPTGPIAGTAAAKKK